MNAKKEERIEEVCDVIISFLEEKKSEKFWAREIADAIELEVERRFHRGITITANSPILSKALKKLVEDGRVRKEYSPSKEADVYWID